MRSVPPASCCRDSPVRSPARPPTPSAGSDASILEGQQIITDSRDFLAHLAALELALVNLRGHPRTGQRGTGGGQAQRSRQEHRADRLLQWRPDRHGHDRLGLERQIRLDPGPDGRPGGQAGSRNRPVRTGADAHRSGLEQRSPISPAASSAVRKWSRTVPAASPCPRRWPSAPSALPRRFPAGSLPSRARSAASSPRCAIWPRAILAVTVSEQRPRRTRSAKWPAPSTSSSRAPSTRSGSRTRSAATG